MRRAIQRLEYTATQWLAENGVHALRLGLGIIFLWFGALKLFPGMSPAEGLIARTVGWIVDPTWFLPLLALWECAIGIGLIVNRWPRLTLLLLFAHMPGTFMPLVACPEVVWTEFPFGWTLEGQYILKNLVLIGGALTLCGRLAVRRPAVGTLSLDGWIDALPQTRIAQRSRRRVPSTLIATRVSLISARSTRRTSCG